MSRLRRFGSSAARLARRRPVPGRADERLDLDQDRPAALHRRRDDAAGRSARMDREEGSRRIGDLHHSGVVHLEHADLVGRPEPVLGRPEQAHRGVPLAFEADHRVDEVLERLGAGDRAVLGDVPDEDHGDPVPLGQVHQAQRRFAHLADAAGRAVQLFDGRRLDRIDDHERRSARPGDLDDATDVVLGQDLDPFSRGAAEQPETGGPQPDLARRFLTRRVEHTARPRPWPGSARPPPGAAGSTCRCRALRRGARGSPGPGRRPARGRARRCPGCRRGRSVSAMRPGGEGLSVRMAQLALGPRRLADDRLDQAVPLAARPALAFPAEERLRAALADEAALRPRHA